MDQSAWVKLAEGVEVIRLWETPPYPKKPEIAILRLSDAMYEKFDDDPQAFLEGKKVFGFKLNRVDHMHAAKNKAQGQKSNSVIILNIHKINCAVLSVSEAEGF
jgi:hypothetical protein